MGWFSRAHIPVDLPGLPRPIWIEHMTVQVDHIDVTAFGSTKHEWLVNRRVELRAVE